MIIDITPTNGRKSFYNKAKIVINENKHQLLSYNTIICEYNIDNGKFIMIYNNKLRSTSRIHLTEFKKLYNIK